MKCLTKISILAFLSFSTLSACGPGNFYSNFSKDNYYNFLDASLVAVNEEDLLYSLSTESRVYAYEERVEYYAKVKHDLNVEEWTSYFKNRLTTKEVDELLYSKKSTLLERYKNYAKKINHKGFENYLNYLSGHTISDLDGAYEVRDANVGSEFEEKYKTPLVVEKDKFLKLRYLFLDMRTAHYSGDYQHTLDLYDKYYGSVSGVKSIVVEWIDALRAGALQHLGKSVASNLLYGKVLENKSNAYLGYYDFKIKNDKEWLALLSQAKTPSDKAKFYFLRALKWEGVPLLEFESIAKIAPKSIWLERLSYMIMQEFQQDAFIYETTEEKQNKYIIEARKVYALKEKRFLKTLTSLKEPSFFNVYAQVYLNFLKKGILESSSFTKLKKMVTNNKEKRLLEVLNYLEKVLQVNKGSQKALFIELESLTKKVSPTFKESLFNYTALHNASVYPEMSAKRIYSKIFADNTYYSQFYISRDAISADSFEEYVEEKNRNYYEQNLFKKSMKILEKNDVAKTLAILYIKDGNFKKAQKYLNQVPTLKRDTENFNPFNVSLSGNNRKPSKQSYTQRKFVETMLKIEESLKKNPKSAMDYYLHATGRYNTSWFGNSPMLASIWRSGGGFSVERGKHILYNYKAIAKEYELALKYARKKEFKAKISYQLLKVRRLQERLGSKKEYSEHWIKESKNLEGLYNGYKDEYSDTQYGKEIIQSCVTFKYFR